MSKLSINKKCDKCGKIYPGNCRICPFCDGKGKDGTDKFQLDDTAAKVIAVIVLFTVGLALFFLAKNLGSDTKKDTGNWSEEASAACRKKSNTYYKCSWNVIEDRCTCKQR